SLKEETELTQAEAAKASYYMPIVLALKSLNPSVLVSGGLENVLEWLVNQGPRIVNCAAQVFQQYIAQPGVAGISVPQEKLAASMVITDILSGLISSGSSGELTTSLYALKAVADSYGIALNAFNVSAEDLNAVFSPAIALVETGYRSHMVMITQVTDTTITYIDPLVGETPVSMTRADFGKIYEGYILSTKAPAQADHVIRDSTLRVLSGSLTEAEALDDKLGTLSQYIAYRIDNLKIINNDLPKTMTLYQAKLQYQLAQTTLSDINLNGDYIILEAGQNPDNTALAFMSAQAKNTKAQAAQLFSAIKTAFEAIDSFTKKARDAADDGQARFDAIKYLGSSVIQHREMSPCLMSIAVTEYDALQQDLADATAIKNLYPDNTEFRQIVEVLTALLGRAGVIKGEIALTASAIVSGLALPTIQHADIDGNGKVDMDDVTAWNDLFPLYADLTGPGGSPDGIINVLDVERMKILLNRLMANALLNPVVVTLSDVNHDGFINAQDVTDLSNALQNRVDVNRDGFVNQLDIDAVKYARDHNKPIMGLEYSRVEYNYNAEKGDNMAYAYSQAVQVIRDAAYATSNQKAAYLFSLLARELAEKSTIEKEKILMTPISTKNVTAAALAKIEENIQLAISAAAIAQTLAAETEKRAQELATDNPIGQVEVLMTSLYTTVNSEILHTMADVAYKWPLSKADLGGIIPAGDLASLWNNLIEHGYINSDGIIQEKFLKLTQASDMALDQAFATVQTAVYNVLDTKRLNADIEQKIIDLKKLQSDLTALETTVLFNRSTRSQLINSLTSARAADTALGHDLDAMMTGFDYTLYPTDADVQQMMDNLVMLAGGATTDLGKYALKQFSPGMTLTQLKQSFENDYPTEILASEEILSEIISYVQKGENALTAKALYDLYNKNGGLLPQLSDDQAKMYSMKKAVESLHLKITDLIDQYRKWAVFDSAGRDADSALAAAQYTTSTALAIASKKIVDEARPLLQQATAAYDAIVTIANIINDTTNETVFETKYLAAITYKALIASNRDNLYLRLKTAQALTSADLTAFYNSANEYLSKAETLINDLLKHGINIRANTVVETARVHVTNNVAGSLGIVELTAQAREILKWARQASVPADLVTQLFDIRDKVSRHAQEIEKLILTANEEAGARLTVFMGTASDSLTEIDEIIDYVLETAELPISPLYTADDVGILKAAVGSSDTPFEGFLRALQTYSGDTSLDLTGGGTLHDFLDSLTVESLAELPEHVTTNQGLVDYLTANVGSPVVQAIALSNKIPASGSWNAQDVTEMNQARKSIVDGIALMKWYASKTTDQKTAIEAMVARSNASLASLDADLDAALTAGATEVTAGELYNYLNEYSNAVYGTPYTSPQNYQGDFKDSLSLVRQELANENFYGPDIATTSDLMKAYYMAGIASAERITRTMTSDVAGGGYNDMNRLVDKSLTQPAYAKPDVVDYTYTYCPDLSNVKASTYNYYVNSDGSIVRGSAADTTSPLYVSYTYRGIVQDVTDNNGDGIFDNEKLLAKNVYYTGLGKSNEVVDYTVNYVGGVAVSRTENYYADGTPLAAGASMTLTDALRKQVTYRLDGNGAAIGKSQELYYLGAKGSEYLEYSYTFQRGGAIAARSDYYYKPDNTRIDYVRTYDIKDTPASVLDAVHGNMKYTSSALMTSQSTYVYDTSYTNI
ncbi:MAG: cysteine peptidase family C39 domain-containing protein, partial [Candidatus Omnitrophica bacterium]|nr:cysteine peptidase family C39 domain-containing protein [Candidatus Omnitrophota bacterium]